MVGRCAREEIEACGPDADLLEGLIERRHPREDDPEFAPQPRADDEISKSLNGPGSAFEFYFTRGDYPARLDLDELLKQRGLTRR
jgi:hypothetical protein